MAKEEDEVLTISKKTHVCDVCGKSFNSGKALGGHISSAHVQGDHNKYHPSLKNIKSNIMKNKASSSSSSSYICSYCGRGFPSYQSLGGHLRCHSQRPAQKGTKPPPDGAETGGRMGEHACWTVKGIRGRQAINHPWATDYSEDNIDFLYNNAVQQLVKLMKLKEEAKCRTSASKKLKNKSGSSIGSELEVNDQVLSSQVISGDVINADQTTAGKVLQDLDLNEVPKWEDEDGIQFMNAGGNHS